jgi:hypothetical protein
LHRIESFDSFILNNIPYAEVPPSDVRWGSVQYDGPNSAGINGGKPALQWHFGGIPYPITKAIRIPYSWTRAWDGSNTIVPASIFLGFQDRLTELVKPQATPFVAEPTPRSGQHQQSYGQFSTQFWGSDAAVLASQAGAVVTRSVRHAGVDAFHDFVHAELNLTDSETRALVEKATPVDFDGPAQDHDSWNVWPYTPATLITEPDKYVRIVWWYFGGKVYSLTKVMRVSLESASSPQGRALFVGYGGGPSENG